MIGNDSSDDIDTCDTSCDDSDSGRDSDSDSIIGIVICLSFGTFSRDTQVNTQTRHQKNTTHKDKIR